MLWSNYAFKRIAEQALRSSQTVVPQPLNAALGVVVNRVEFWNSFHDGSIENISGVVPGPVTLEVAIEYLRHRFPGPGESFRVLLSECTLFEYEAYEEQPIADLAAISKLEPMVLSVETEEPIVVNCVMGTLRLAYGSASITTNAGQAVSSEQLKQASIEYWAEWSAKHRGNA